MQTNGFPETLQHDYGRNREPTAFQQSAERMIASLDGFWLFRPWFYFAIGFLLIAFTLWRFGIQRLEVTLLAASGFAHEAALFLIAPSPDYRYSHYTVFATTLAVMLLLRPTLSRLTFGCRNGVKIAA